MTGIDSVELQKAIVHKVGNPTRGEELKLSANLLTLNDELVSKMLVKYFLSSFNEKEHYRLTHLSDLQLNEVYNYASQIFENPEDFQSVSALLASFLYQKSTHARVKEGELYFGLLKNVPLENEDLQALVMIKSESKESFLKVFAHGKNFEVISEEGINIEKPDKGCIIFRTKKAEGYIVCIIDYGSRQNDTQYWINDFLQAEPISNSYHNTDKYLGLCKQFVTHEYAEKFEVTKSEQIDLLNRSMEYFKTKDQFSMEEFAEEVIHHREVIDTFKDYKKNYESAKNFEIEDSFGIDLSAVKKQSRAFKSVLKLDKNFHVYIHGRNDLIEKGFDSDTGKHFYKLYFDQES